MSQIRDAEKADAAELAANGGNKYFTDDKRSNYSYVT
jgi:hypothetical protein